MRSIRDFLKKPFADYFDTKVIVGALPNNIQNGQTEDAVPVMANYNWIVNQVNANAAQLTLTPQLASANVFTAKQTVNIGATGDSAQFGHTIFSFVGDDGSSMGVTTATGLTGSGFKAAAASVSLLVNSSVVMTATGSLITSALNSFTIASGTALPANGSAAIFIGLTSNGIGIYAGSGAPNITAPKGSFYLRSDGSGVGDRAYINTNGSTTWTAITTVA